VDRPVRPERRRAGGRRRRRREHSRAHSSVWRPPRTPIFTSSRRQPGRTHLCAIGPRGGPGRRAGAREVQLSDPAGRRSSRRPSTCGPYRRRKRSARAGALQAKVYGIGSIAFGNVSPHINAGYTRTSRGGLPNVSLHNEWNYAAGFDVAVSPRLTLIADVIGRSIRDQGRLRRSRYRFRFRGGGSRRNGGSGRRGRRRWGRWRVWRHTHPAGRARHTTSVPTGARQPEPLVGSTGVRFNPFRKMLVSAKPAVCDEPGWLARPCDARDQRRLFVLTRVLTQRDSRRSITQDPSIFRSRNVVAIVCPPATPLLVTNDRVT
jgi:hypothetical protein